MNSGGYKIKLIPPEFDDKKRTHEALLQYSSCSTSETLVAAELCLLTALNDQPWNWKWLISTIIYMDIEDMAWYGQWTLKMFGQGTLKNMLNVDDTYTRISTIVPDTYP